MSHQFTSGVFLNNEPAWHKLGTVLDGTMPAREAFATADADWNTISTPVFDPAGEPIPGYQAITRGDTGNVLSIQGESYTIENQLITMVARFICEAKSGDILMLPAMASLHKRQDGRICMSRQGSLPTPLWEPLSHQIVATIVRWSKEDLQAA